SWNNNHYMVLSSSKAIEVPTRAADGFFPRVDDIKPHLTKARILFINSPLNPAGTIVTRESLTALCDLVLEENHRRDASRQPALIQAFTSKFLEGLNARLTTLHRGIQSMKAKGLPVDSIEPQGAIYLSLRFDLVGKKTPGGTRLETGEAIRRYLLEEAGMA